jgi:Na+/melibiose symporter-like transporter
MHSTTQKLSVKEKVGFSLGDSAANFIFQTMMLLQLSFYTDTFGLTAAAAGTLFLIARLWGAVVDPVMGAIGDRTDTRWGKFRPWILWTAVPFGIIGFLAFLTPDFSHSGKLAYAYITYILLLTIYSMNNIPYSALSGVITGDMKERTSLFSFRFVFVCLATIAIQGFALPMVNHFGQGDSSKGYGITMGIFSGLAMLFLLFTFFTTKERVKPDPQQKTSLKEDLASLLRNRPWVLMFVLFLMMFVFLAIRNGNLLYFFRYYLDRDSLGAFMESVDKGLLGLPGKLGFTGEAHIADGAFSFINILGQIASIIGIMISNAIAVKFGKRDVFIAGLVLAAICTALFIIIPPDGIMLTLVLQIFFNLAWGITMMLPWAMMADVADYSEWKLNRRATGIVFAGIVVGLKVGLAVGGFLGAYILSLYGYVANVEQTPHALTGIRLSSSIFPTIALCVVILILFFYTITKSMELKIQDDLVERRKAYQA